MSRRSFRASSFTRVGASAAIAAVLVLFAISPAVAGAAPTISSFDPGSGPVGTAVRIHGTNFTGTTSVTFNGTNAPGFSVNGSGQRIDVNVPSGATTGPIVVTTPQGSGQSATSFTVTGVPPTITSFNPAQGPVGTTVTIHGTNFAGVSSVKFNGTAASFSFVTNVKVTAVVPSGATTGKITLTTPSGTATSATNFTVSGPKINGFSPTSGNVGTTVTINGVRFTGVTSVRFNGTAATFSFVNDGTVTAVVPSGATTGPISLTTPSGTATSTTSFTVFAEHSRTISLSLGRGGVRATGHVGVNDGYDPCQRFVPVVVKRFHSGSWHWVTTTSTGQQGNFRATILDRFGLYRARAIKIQLVNGAVCGGRLSNTVHHRR